MDIFNSYVVANKKLLCFRVNHPWGMPQLIQVSLQEGCPPAPQVQCRRSPLPVSTSPLQTSLPLRQDLELVHNHQGSLITHMVSWWGKVTILLPGSWCQFLAVFFRRNVFLRRDSHIWGLYLYCSNLNIFYPVHSKVILVTSRGCCSEISYLCCHWLNLSFVFWLCCYIAPHSNSCSYSGLSAESCYLLFISDMVVSDNERVSNIYCH